MIRLIKSIKFSVLVPIVLNSIIQKKKYKNKFIFSIIFFNLHKNESKSILVVPEIIFSFPMCQELRLKRNKYLLARGLVENGLHLFDTYPNHNPKKSPHIHYIIDAYKTHPLLHKYSFNILSIILSNN